MTVGVSLGYRRRGEAAFAREQLRDESQGFLRSPVYNEDDLRRMLREAARKEKPGAVCEPLPVGNDTGKWWLIGRGLSVVSSHVVQLGKATSQRVLACPPRRGVLIPSPASSL